MSERTNPPAVRLVSLLASAASLVLLPLGLRPANHFHPAPDLQPSYLPSIEAPRERLPFDAGPIAELARMNPGFVVIGDSMAGTRIDPVLFARLTERPVAPLLHAGSGPVWWYLVLKNWVIPSRIHPQGVFIFFRDTNLTNILFRIDATWVTDTAAHDREDDLNAVVARRRGSVFRRVHGAIENLYQVPEARHWIEPAMNAWPADLMIPYRRLRASFMQRLNDRFGLDHLRIMDAADMQAIEDREADFDAFVDRSVLPLMLRDARQAGLSLCFVRVQRRPEGNGPPVQSRALARYAAKLKTYIERNGGTIVDDTGDPLQTLDWYADGDHLSREGRRRYTELFVSRLQQRLR
jgi:hypothetical protein